ncbi:PREDICTED: hepatitis A virus cellular receptor 1-like [Acromyrmex echinatior]|uniref:hepatitis A virus cellular receptor 1-like n=1 Tax=Acromyrmex echinatior TaxID=103372 RepID=UPI000580DFD6|nr:PREDICTED: hepatitis A virus cellular receptor 1-like [Acromyrmex echinatior]
MAPTMAITMTAATTTSLPTTIMLPTIFLVTELFTATLPTTTTTLPMTTITLPTTTITLPTTTRTLPMITTAESTTTSAESTITIAEPTITTTLPTTINTTLPTTPTTTTMTTMISPTMEVPIVNTNVVIELNRSKIVTNVFTPYVDFRISEIISNATSVPACESAECITEQNITSKYVETTPTLFLTTQSSTTTPTIQTSILETTEPPHYQDLITDSTISTTELIETPTTKGCVQVCLEEYEFNAETMDRSCETNCDSTQAVTEDCNENNPPGTSSQECDKKYCDTKEKSGECMTLCPPKSSLCENGDCVTTGMPPLIISFAKF